MRARAALVMVFLVTASLAATPAAGSGLRGAPQCAGRAATIWGGPGDDVLPGTSGPDVIAGLARNDLITGGDRNDVLCGGAGDDRLEGGVGHDVLLGGPGNDFLLGGGGRDWVSFEESASGVIASVGAGVATGEGEDLLDSIEGLKGSVFADSLQGRRLWGNSGDDVLTGTPRHDTLIGNAGKDELRGLGGDDSLMGGSGNDLVYGGRGDDGIWARSGEDMLSGQDGADRLSGGSESDRMFGGDGPDRLDGSDGTDLLRGGAGHDDLVGGSGDDTIHGGPGDDLLDDPGWGGRGVQEGVDLLNGDAGWDICWMEGADGCEAIPGPACLGCGEGSETTYPVWGAAMTLYVAPDPLRTSTASWFDFAGNLLVPNPGSCPAETTVFPYLNTTLHFFYAACAARPAGAYRVECAGTAECEAGLFIFGGWFVLTPEGWRE